MASNSRISRTMPLLIAFCLVSFPAQAQYGEASGMAASGETSTYVFVPGQSELVQTGGIAYVHWTYSVEGDFELAIDPNAGTASFTRVDANATDDSPFKRTLDPNQVFNMTSLVGTVLEDGTIQFTGKASDDSDILITVALTDGLAHLVGNTTPPPHSADFFIFEIDAVAQRKYGGGTGEPNDPYQIATAEDLILLGKTPEDYDKHFILTADIDLDPNLPEGQVFDRAVLAPDMSDVEEGFQGISFAGVFDGNGHTVSHLTITGGTYLGLFGVLGNGAEVKNLGVVHVNITSCASVGGLAVQNSGAVFNCYSTGSVTGSGNVGGLVGSNGGSITMSHSTATATGDRFVGGLVGVNHGSITTSYSTGSVSGNDDVSGMVGVGGLVGLNISGSLITSSYSTGSVKGDNSVKGDSSVGGLVGYNRGSGITASYSTGSVTGNDYIGGLVGLNTYGSITTSFWDIQTSAQTTSVGGDGKTTAEMQMASTFLEAGWDFVNVWGIGENQTYPYLRKYSAADIDQDESVNFGDLAILADNWLASIAP